MANDKDIRYTVTAEDRFTRTFAQLKRDLKDGGEQLAGITRLAGSAGGALAGIGGGLAGGGSFLVFKQLANDLDALNAASGAIGDSIENLSALEDVARRNGEGLELVTSAALKLNKALSEAKADSPMARSLDAIGLSAAELRNLEPSEAIRRVAVALRGYENDGRRAAIVQEIFGKSTEQVAAFLKDVAEAGQLNATVTAAQAAEAARFNKQLFAMQTELSNVGREMAGPVLSALNQMFDAIEGRGVGGDSVISRGLVVPLQALTVLGANVGFVLKGIGTEVGGIAAQAAALARGDFAGARSIGDAMKADAKGAREEFDLLEKRLMSIGRVLPQADYSNEGRNRGAALRRAPDLSGGDPKKAAQQSAGEAERYLDRLQKEGEKLQELTSVQQLLRDIEFKRIDGVTPKLRTKLFLEAASVDAMKAQNKELQAQQQAMDDLVASVSRRADELDRLLAATPTGRAKAIEQQVDVVLRYAQANPNDEAIQRQVLEATRQLRKEFDGLVDPPKEVAKEVDKMQVTIDRFAEKSIDALADFAATGKGSFDSLFDSFKRDVLRELIEDPVRDAMKNVVNIIRSELGKAGEGEGLLGGLFKAIQGASSGNGGGGGGWGALIARLFGGQGYTGKAGGGNVRAGQLVRWQEGGREWFVPQQDGTVVNQAQMRAASAGAGLQQVNHYHINGNDPATMRAELRAALDERDARLMRSLRNGRASAYVGA